MVFLLASMCDPPAGLTKERGKKPRPADSVGSSGRTGILVGDDDPGVRRVLEVGFGRTGRSVWLAGDGEEVLEQYRRHAKRIEAVLLDVDMPKRSGLDALAELRRIDPAVRVFLMSGVCRYTSDEIGRLGAAGFLAKPFPLLDLVQGVLDHLVSASCGSTRGRN